MMYGVKQRLAATKAALEMAESAWKAADNACIEAMTAREMAHERLVMRRIEHAHAQLDGLRDAIITDLQPAGWHITAEPAYPKEGTYIIGAKVIRMERYTKPRLLMRKTRIWIEGFDVRMKVYDDTHCQATQGNLAKLRAQGWVDKDGVTA